MSTFEEPHSEDTHKALIRSSLKLGFEEGNVHAVSPRELSLSSMTGFFPGLGVGNGLWVPKSETGIEGGGDVSSVDPSQLYHAYPSSPTISSRLDSFNGHAHLSPAISTIVSNDTSVSARLGLELGLGMFSDTMRSPLPPAPLGLYESGLSADLGIDTRWGEHCSAVEGVTTYDDVVAGAGSGGVGIGMGSGVLDPSTTMSSEAEIVSSMAQFLNVDIF